MIWIVLIYGFGLRAAFYSTIVRFSDARDDYYPKKDVRMCGTEARNILSTLSILSEVADVVCAVFCLPEFYIIRKAIVDGITLARYGGRYNPRYYGIMALIGITVYTMVVCSKLSIAAISDTCVQILIEIMMKPGKRKWGSDT